jgi:hypothetical protein
MLRYGKYTDFAIQKWVFFGNPESAAVVTRNHILSLANHARGWEAAGRAPDLLGPSNQ